MATLQIKGQVLRPNGNPYGFVFPITVEVFIGDILPLPPYPPVYRKQQVAYVEYTGDFEASFYINDTFMEEGITRGRMVLVGILFEGEVGSSSPLLDWEIFHLTVPEGVQETPENLLDYANQREYAFTLDLSHLTVQEFRIANRNDAIDSAPYVHIDRLSFASPSRIITGGYAADLFVDENNANLDTPVFLKLMTGRSPSSRMLFKTRNIRLGDIFDGMNAMVIDTVNTTMLQQDINDSIDPQIDSGIIRLSDMQVDLTDGKAQFTTSIGLQVAGYVLLNIGRATADVSIAYRVYPTTAFDDYQLNHLFSVHVTNVDYDIFSTDLGDLPWWVAILTGGMTGIMAAIELAVQEVIPQQARRAIANRLQAMVNAEMNRRIAEFRESLGDDLANEIASSFSFVGDTLEIVTDEGLDRIEATGIAGFVHSLAHCAFTSSATFFGRLSFLNVFRSFQKALEAKELTAWMKEYTELKRDMLELFLKKPEIGLKVGLFALKSSKYVQGKQAQNTIKIKQETTNELTEILEVARKHASKPVALFLEDVQKVVAKSPDKTFREMVKIAAAHKTGVQKKK